MFHPYCLSPAFYFMKMGEKTEACFFFLSLNENWANDGRAKGEINTFILQRGC